jgi:hypothetical protein
MARHKRRDDFDSPWKEVLHRYLREFLAFFFADIERDVDWTRPYEALDKEFQQIIRRAKVPKSLADKLFKVWLRDGNAAWLLIHVEVQGTFDPEFAERMFRYNVATYSLYNQHVVGLAALCDENPAWRPDAFSYGRWGCRTGIQFRIAKLLDHAHDLAALEASPNPMGAVVLAHLQALATRRDPPNRLEWKRRVARGLYQHDWSEQQVRELFRLVDWLMDLPERLEEIFRIDLHRFEQEKDMPYVTSVERLARKEGREEGFVEGIAVALVAKFGKEARKLMPDVQKLPDMAALRNLAKAIENAQNLDEVRKHLRKRPPR